MGYATREVVNLETTTVLYKELFEVRTRDDVRLIVTRKRPVERARDRTRSSSSTDSARTGSRGT